ncbi:Cadherin-related hmr-1, partial [Toxocara canis]
PLDYEDPTQRDGFNIGVRVYDGRYYATTRLLIRLEDRNDNAPIVSGPQRAQVFEDAPRDTVVAKFSVFDADANDTATDIGKNAACMNSAYKGVIPQNP